MTTCPDCKGEKKLPALVNRGEKGCSREQITCITCHGSGEVADDYARRRGVAEQTGRLLKAGRLARNETLLQAALRLNMSVSEYSRLERGVVLP